MNQFRKCHCGKDLRHVGNYPLDDWSKEKYASQCVYACEDKHEQHVPRYTMTSACPNCKNSEWDFKLIGNDNSEWKCKTCGFRLVQTGLLRFYKFQRGMVEEPCLLCGADNVGIDSDWHSPVYALEKDESINDRMLSNYYECPNCSASYSKKKCLYCGVFAVSMSEKRERKASGRDYAVWQNLCHCHNCHNEWYVGGGWGD